MISLTRAALLALAPAAALVSLLLAATVQPALALINESPSLPRGLYLRDLRGEPVTGAIVAIDQPASVRPYLARLGMPAKVRLIKRVAASAGDLVCSDGRRLRTPDRTVAVPDHDRSGVALPVWRGCRPLGPDERLLLGDTPNSLDSRFFGPVSVARIEGVYRETLTW